MAQIYGQPLDLPVQLGRKAVIRYSETITTFAANDFGQVSQADLDLWVQSSLETQEVRNVQLLIQPEYVDITPRKIGALRMRQFERIANTVSIQFDCHHYLATDSLLENSSGAAVGTRFPWWIMQQASLGEVGLMFLENNQTNTAGFAGNFLIGQQKTENIRGLQQWTYTATATKYFEIFPAIYVGH